jgi:hypothetical protein
LSRESHAPPDIDYASGHKYYGPMNSWLFFDDSSCFLSILSGLTRHIESTEGLTNPAKGNNSEFNATIYQASSGFHFGIYSPGSTNR